MERPGADDPPNDDAPSEFSRFETLTKRLLAVPKDVLDKARSNGSDGRPA